MDTLIYNSERKTYNQPVSVHTAIGYAAPGGGPVYGIFDLSSGRMPVHTKITVYISVHPMSLLYIDDREVDIDSSWSIRPPACGNSDQRYG